jgi:hypothetical protein
MEDQKPNGLSHPYPLTDIPAQAQTQSQVNGIHDTEPIVIEEVAEEELERELPVVNDGQVPLGDLLSRVVQAVYAELSELADTYVFPL